MKFAGKNWIPSAKRGAFYKDQDEMLNAVKSRMTQKIAGSVARKLKELPDKREQELMATGLQRLFHLQAPKTAIAAPPFLEHVEAPPVDN
jgi:hypothetical protein